MFKVLSGTSILSTNLKHIQQEMHMTPSSSHNLKMLLSLINSISKLLKKFTRKEDSAVKDMTMNGILNKLSKIY